MESSLMTCRQRLTAVCYFTAFSVVFLVFWISSFQTNGYGAESSRSSFDIPRLEQKSSASFESYPYHISRRHLLFMLPNCTPPAVEQFPRVFTQFKRQHGGVFLCILLALYSFLGLAIACDDYFVPSLKKISDALKLQPDVAGATFMAAGSSAPELAIAVIGVFVAKDDIGLGAVVGSAVFNILFVISVCALFASTVVSLYWWPLVRDSMVYLLSILALTFIIMDEQILWYESVSLLVLYILYIILMIYNQSIKNIITTQFVCCRVQGRDSPEELTSEKALDGSYDHIELTTPSGKADSEESGLVKKDDGEPDTRLAPPEGIGWRVMWFVSLPLIFLMFLTIPDVRRPRWRHWFVVTFLMSCLWISALSYLMVWMITVTGHTLHIPDTVMSLTLIAAGVSVPDAISSLIVIREGQGDMAISNAIGSNVFDILVCLGLPWFLKTCVILPGSCVEVYSAGLFYASITLFSTVFFLLIVTWLNKWTLTRKYGVILMIAYFSVTLLTILYELNIFGFVHPPECLTIF